MPFVHLHVHTQYSILDGAAPIKKLFEKASADGQIALAITDHGNMFGVKEFLEVSAKYPGVKPIVGCEFYVARESRTQKRGREDQSSFHLILLAKNKTGYKNLIKLASYAYIDGYYYKPRIDRDLLEKYSEGLICSSACLAGEVSRAIGAENLNEARETVKWYKDIFGEDYYLELQRHETDIPGADTSVFSLQQKVNSGILKLAEELGVKCIATNDVHFVSKEDGPAHDRLICLTTNANYDDEERLRYTQQEYLKTQEEMAEIFKDLPHILENTIEIAEKIEVYDIESKPIMPHFPLPEGFADSDEYLRDLTYKGAAARYEQLGEKERERIDFELETIKKMGFPDYFLIVQDFIAAARNLGVSVGPGRGSAAGSVVAYCLRITDMDPLRYNLLFERFLNPDRISMPDIDIDFDDDGRAKVLRYVEEKYGKDHVSHVITFGTMAAKSAIRDIARIQRLPLSESDRLAKLIPVKFPPDKEGKSPAVTLENCIRYVPELQEAAQSNDPVLAQTLEYAKRLEGTVRNTGVHACAIIIGRDDLREFIPISTAKDKDTGEEMWVSQYEGSQIEKVGMLKMDFLGLKTLSIIKEALANIRASKGIDLDIDSISLYDEETYNLFSRGDSVATFQFESDGMRKWLRELKPSRFEDLIAMNALYRPGPMDYIPDFVDRKHGRKKVEYDLPEMEEILQDTYGVTVYQEQVMLLSQKLAGFSKGDADGLRKAMGKKIREMMDKMKAKFLDGGTSNGHSANILEKIWKDWEAFAQYAFNKSHSTCYAWIGYQTAYLKAHYPAEFMAATLSRNLNNMDEITKFMDECKRMGIQVLSPDVNESSLSFTVNKDGNIRFGMAGIKGVGGGAVEAIIEARKDSPFTSVFDFFEKVNLSAVNKKALESLIFAGAFDSFSQIRREQFFVPNPKGETYLDQLVRYGNKSHADAQMLSSSLFGGVADMKLEPPEIPACEEGNKNELLKKEKDLVGMFLSSHPLDRFSFEINNFTNISLSELSDMIAQYNPDKEGEKEFIIAGIVTGARTSYTRSTGKPMVNFTIEDFNGNHSFSLFGRDYENFMKYTQEGEPLLIKCRMEPKFGYAALKKSQEENKKHEYELKIKNITLLSNTKEKFIREFVITLPLDHLDAGLRKQLVSVVKENKGTSALVIKALDYRKRLAVEFISTKYTISITDSLLDYLRNTDIEYSFTPTLSF